MKNEKCKTRNITMSVRVVSCFCISFSLPLSSCKFISSFFILHFSFVRALIPIPLHEPPPAVAVAVNAAERSIVQCHVPFVSVPRLWAYGRVGWMNGRAARTRIPHVRGKTRRVSRGSFSREVRRYAGPAAGLEVGPEVGPEAGPERPPVA